MSSTLEEMEADYRRRRARENKRRSRDARKMRRELQMSLREVASVAGCSAMFVCDLERGKRGWAGPAAQRVWGALVIKHAVRA